MTTTIKIRIAENVKKGNQSMAAEKKTNTGEGKKDIQTTALISMSMETKRRLTLIARDHGMSLSAFLRLAADEFIERHGWELKDDLSQVQAE